MGKEVNGLRERVEGSGLGGGLVSAGRWVQQGVLTTYRAKGSEILTGLKARRSKSSSECF